jgi:DNA (cytosine-5)-methyltransferase 1
MQDFSEKIQNIDSKRKDEYLKEIWNKISLDVEKDYIFFNSVKQTEKFETAMTEHKNILEAMGYYNNPIMNLNLEDDSDNLLSEIDRIKKRMAHIPPGENHKFVRNTEHHVSGLMSNIYKRIHPLQPSYTVIANGGGGTWGYHYNINRQKLTNRERARIQTFPDWFSFCGKPSQVRTQIGNAVPPFGIKPFAEELLKIIKEIN